MEFPSIEKEIQYSVIRGEKSWTNISTPVLIQLPKPIARSEFLGRWRNIVNTIIEKTRLVAFVETTAGYNVHIRTKEFDLIYACRARKSKQVLQASFEELNPRRQEITRDTLYKLIIISNSFKERKNYQINTLKGKN